MAKDLPVVTVNVFPGGFNWPIFVAQDKGFFAANGIAVEVQSTPDSVTQMTGFSLGEFDIAMTAIDNIVAYVEGQGQAPIGPQPDFMAFMGVDTGFLSLVAAPAIKTIADLRSKTASVDAMTTGYAFVLYEILRRNNLDKDNGDYDLVGAGGMAQRWKGLSEGRHQATLLSAPYNLIARAAGFSDLVRATDVIGPYQGNVAAARRSWAAENKERIIGYIRAYRSAVAWLYDRANRTDAIEILSRHLPQLPQEITAASYSELLHPTHGFFPSCELDRTGLACVLELRDRYASSTKALSAPETYYDPSYSDAARLL
ncbi:MAG TPA: ABC transporter substrate-binding protein [Candidatus Binataceae bacterium]|jgi:ABC-type nitrate/sulfonate/bicarbonate transport system substrate-binding protein